MKRYLCKLAALFLALALPFALLVGAVLLSPDTKFTNSLPYSLHYKVDLLQNTPGRRIIFAGGSASEYAILCQDVSEAAQRPAICIGVTAYLGLDIYLGLLDTYARTGDTVVLTLENIMLRGNSANYLLLWQALGSDPDAWAAVRPAAWPGLLMTAWRYYQSRVPAGWRPWQDGLHWPDYSAASQPGNLPAGFGPLGDIVDERPETLLASGYNTEDMIALDADVPQPKNLAAIRAFTRRMQQRGVQVLFAYAPLDALCVTTTPEQNAAYAAAVEAGLGLPVLVTLEESLMDAPYFYNTNNHLTTPGAELYTKTLLTRLLPLL